MIPHDIIDGRWKKITMDIMTFHRQDYLVLVDYYSKYPEFTHLPYKTAKTIVERTKSLDDLDHFTKYVIGECSRGWPRCYISPRLVPSRLVASSGLNKSNHFR